jgi:hypothetical protein
VSVLISRLNRIVDRSNTLEAIQDNDPTSRQLKESIPRLRRRAKLISRAIQCAVMSGIATTLLMIIAFVTAALGFDQVYGAAVLFVFALGFFAVALVCLWLEVRIAIGGLDGFL